MASQLAFELPVRQAFGFEDFLVSDANRAAVNLIDQWPAWSHWAAVITGGDKTGKSHLGNVWRLKSGADAIAAGELSEATIALFSKAGALLVEDLHCGIANDRILFHLLNLAREHRGSILLTSAVPPGGLSIALPDLRSRLRAIPVATILPPDEALLRGVLIKLFADRQLAIDPPVIAYLARHMDRSLGTAYALVERLDRASLERGRAVTRALAIDVLAHLGSAEGEDEAQ